MLGAHGYFLFVCRCALLAAEGAFGDLALSVSFGYSHGQGILPACFYCLCDNLQAVIHRYFYILQHTGSRYEHD